VLHDVFDVPFAQIAPMLGRTPEAARQLASRAELRPVLVSGAAGLLISLRGRPAALMAFTVAGGRITAVDRITDPRRVGRLVSQAAGEQGRLGWPHADCDR
jgi:RNA polymerase sigma-70 factor (ECF subfamily)